MYLLGRSGATHPIREISVATDAPNALERWLRIAGVTLTLVGLLAGAYQFTRNQAVEASRPFLERKLKWCEGVPRDVRRLDIYIRLTRVLVP